MHFSFVGLHFLQPKYLTHKKSLIFNYFQPSKGTVYVVSLLAGRQMSVAHCRGNQAHIFSCLDHQLSLRIGFPALFLNRFQLRRLQSLARSVCLWSSSYYKPAPLRTLPLRISASRAAMRQPGADPRFVGSVAHTVWDTLRRRGEIQNQL